MNVNKMQRDMVADKEFLNSCLLHTLKIGEVKAKVSPDQNERGQVVVKTDIQGVQSLCLLCIAGRRSTQITMGNYLCETK